MKVTTVVADPIARLAELEEADYHWPHPVKPAWELKLIQRWWGRALADLGVAC